MYNKVCIQCKEKYETKDRRQKCCGRSCGGKYGNKGRKLTDEHKKKVSKSLKLFYKNNPHRIRRGEKAAAAVAGYTKGKYLEPKNIFDLNNRTRGKVMRRLKVSCSRCEWNEAPGDLHHIYGRKIKDPHNHKHLSYLCPNCHRMAEVGKIKPEELMTFREQVGNRWKKYYYG